jgi:hypothetical protein
MQRFSRETLEHERHRQTIRWARIAVIVAIVLGVPGTIVAVRQCRGPSAHDSTEQPVTPAQSSQKTSVHSSVTYEEVLRTLTNATLTNLQRDEFERQNQGKIIEWTVKVSSVERKLGSDANRGFVVIFGPQRQDEKLKKIVAFATAIFPADLKDEMVSLNTGEIIRLRGTLLFEHNLLEGMDVRLTVEDCMILERIK